VVLSALLILLLSFAVGGAVVIEVVDVVWDLMSTFVLYSLLFFYHYSLILVAEGII
jgi:hypothetical protein